MMTDPSKIFRFLEKISDFWTIFRFSKKLQILKNVQIFGKILDFRKIFRFSKKFQIFQKISDFWNNFRFLEHF